MRGAPGFCVWRLAGCHDVNFWGLSSAPHSPLYGIRPTSFQYGMAMIATKMPASSILSASAPAI